MWPSQERFVFQKELNTCEQSHDFIVPGNFTHSTFMAWMFRSVKMILVSFIPNLTSIDNCGFNGIHRVPIKPSTILVFSIAFGISVDDTIHFRKIPS